ncbi:hypothetical protein M2451_003858 [Dysgonomonas sp. PFB1-18]|nr:hypothetical protein [Dysgonomonas sp. PF1-14]MDH6340870.1 hypothetical protein [Dysgonomonas sp. PF1-16]MDH6382517.1 hypothetical protein [Dysgonomonas sp. PFB1-18]MDH6399839.1 hypothetical protein [Dysgonomonas sp. PF1-23]
MGKKANNMDAADNDVIVVSDKKEKKIEVVKKAGKDGVETVPPEKERQNEFLKIGHNSDPSDVLITFVKNFYSQARDPTRFGIYKIPFKTFDTFLNSLKWLNNQINSNIKKELMEKDSKNQETVPENNTDRKNRFMPSQINWDQLKNLGITREYLEQKGLLDQMLQGRKTNQLIPISVQQGGAHVTTDAKLSLRQEQDGSVSLRIHGVKKEPELDRPYFGHVFSEEDKKNLRETGHLGRVVDLYDRSNAQHPSFISIDPLTKEITSIRAKGVYIPDDVSGVKLMDHEKEALRNGKEIFVEGMTARSGKEFDAYLRVDANERRVSYRFEEGLANIRKIGGVELNEQQRNDLTEGKAILVEGMVNKQTGELRDSYVKAADLATGKLQFTNFNPDSPEEKREIIIPRYIGQVLLTNEDRRELSEGKPIFLKDQVRASGETYDSFVRLHPATGDIQRSRTPEGFTEEVKVDIPKEISGVKVTAKMRADIQDGKAVEIKGAKAPDGTLVPTFVKMNKDTNLLSFYRENPDQAKKATIKQGADDTSNKQAPAEDKKSKSRKIG